ncbi:hypothetical protein [Spirosoma pollinicola]|uniref:Uncharacterized protein n=1 Tax=Spirosoma pollinicola TaxID=2057025 RepID=A0A2K8Z9W8_9BACT|nr:hypothetical protein [Spirosoma pollinicola]AUD06644.1 hypothetical protein CWM47_35240 [Spirosoma pollinicola]
MEAICGGLIGFLLGYLLCMVLASLEVQLGAKREDKVGELYKQQLEEQQASITKQNQLIAQLVEDKAKLVIRQQQVSDKLSELRKQHERTLSALN